MGKWDVVFIYFFPLVLMLIDYLKNYYFFPLLIGVWRELTGYARRAEQCWVHEVRLTLGCVCCVLSVSSHFHIVYLFVIILLPFLQIYEFIFHRKYTNGL